MRKDDEVYRATILSGFRDLNPFSKSLIYFYCFFIQVFIIRQKYFKTCIYNHEGLKKSNLITLLSLAHENCRL